MFRLLLFIVLSLLVTPLYAAELPKVDEQKTFYAIGLSVARSLSVFNLTPAEVALVQQGIADSFNGKKIDAEFLAYNAKIQELARERRKIAGEKQVGAGKEFLEKAAKEKGAVKTTSGMVYNSLLEGTGTSPKATDVVKVNYRGTLVDGVEFDSSYKRGKALEFKLSNVISCWVEGVQMMKPGGKAKLVCPPNLAYGENGSGEMILPGATLAFEVELLEVMAPSPADKAAVPEPVKPAEPAKK
ncbi:MAG TPA: FKBP-type peptidyl-prolyl cis-trans isomerase [Desulfuromonadales bacterium]|nr:FKBP-type peptidyl-prolyl cis-trans isomerase [Desulfuromonadales bacterium]